MIKTMQTISTKPQLVEWLKKKNEDQWRETKYRFAMRIPQIGEMCLVMDNGRILFCRRTSKNYLSSGGTIFPFDNYSDDNFMTIELVEEEKCEDAADIDLFFVKQLSKMREIRRQQKQQSKEADGKSH